MSFNVFFLRQEYKTVNIVTVIFSVPMTVTSWINMNATKKFKIKGDSSYAFCGFLEVKV